MKETAIKNVFMYLISAALFTQYLIIKMVNGNCVLYSTNSRFCKCHGCYTDSVS